MQGQLQMLVQLYARRRHAPSPASPSNVSQINCVLRWRTVTRYERSEHFAPPAKCRAQTRLQTRQLPRRGSERIYLFTQLFVPLPLDIRLCAARSPPHTAALRTSAAAALRAARATVILHA